MHPQEIANLLGKLSVGDIKKLARLQEQALSERDFWITFLSQKRKNAEFDSRVIDAWSEEFLIEVVNCWLQQLDLPDLPETTPLSLREAKHILLTHVDTLNEWMTDEMLDAVKSAVVAVTTVQPLLPDVLGAASLFQQALAQPVIHNALAGLDSFSSQATGFITLADVLVEPNLSSHASLLTEWTEAMGLIDTFSARDVIAHVTGLGEILEGHIALSSDTLATAVSGISILTGELLGTFNWGDIGSAVGLDTTLKTTLGAEFLGLSSAYDSLIKSWEYDRPRSPLSGLVLLPSLEYYSNVDVLESISNTSIDLELNQRRWRKRNELAVETNDALRMLLSALDADLVPLLDGARQAMKSNNVDRARHVAISLRELFTQVLHRLSPDGKVRSWTSDPKYFDRGKPTRKCRLLYICRNVNNGSMQEFVERDIEATLSMMGLFQRGTHEIAVDYTADQLYALSIRMETAIRFLLEIARIEV